MSNFQALADEYATLKAQMEEYEQKLKKMRAEILATGQETIVGERAIVEVKLSERNSLDTSSIRKLFTEEQIVAMTKTTLVETLKVKPRF